jgi:hypothetical protein
MHISRRIFKAGPAVALVALALPASAMAQATRTWVSGVGDDANPCSRTAPCKTFAGAISKTANGGEINVIDPGGFGGVTIGKSLTIKAEGLTGGVLVSGTNAIVVNATSSDKVTLKGLDINGIGTGAPTSLTGVKVLSARSVHILDSEIYRFKAGVSVQTTAPTTNVVIWRSHIHDNGVGVFNGPGVGTVTSSFTTIRDSVVADNNCNAVASAFGPNSSTIDQFTNCGAQTSASGFNIKAVISAFHSSFNDAAQTGLLSRGSQAVVRLGDNDVTGNTVGLQTLDGGVLKSFGDNHIDGNSSTAAPGSITNVAPTKRHFKRVSKKHL